MGISTSTGTLIAGQSRTFNLSPASAVTLTLSPNVRVTITETPATVAATGLGGNASRVHEPRLPGTFTYGPYPMGGTVVVDVESNSGSSVGWVRSDSIIAESADGAQALVDGGGNTFTVPKIIGQGLDIAGSRTITGSTTETSVYSLTIPGGTMDANSSLRVSALMSMTNNANVKTMRIKFGNTTPLTLTATPASVAVNSLQATIQNMGSQSAQEAHPSIVTSFGSSAAALATGANNTAIDQLLEITLQLTVSGDTASLRRVLVELIRP